VISVESATGPNLELAASRSLQVAESNGGSNDQQPRLLLEHPSFVSVEELARRKGIEHIKTIEELACDGVFDTDEEVDEFLVFVTEQRHANLS
jgi:hypothetical protein